MNYEKALVLLSSLMLKTGMVLLGTGCIPESTDIVSDGIASFEHDVTVQGKIIDAITG